MSRSWPRPPTRPYRVRRKPKSWRYWLVLTATSCLLASLLETTVRQWLTWHP